MPWEPTLPSFLEVITHVLRGPKNLHFSRFGGPKVGVSSKESQGKETRVIHIGLIMDRDPCNMAYYGLL